MPGAGPIPLDEARDHLRSGGALGFPTETVFGVGADALNPAAVERVYAIKGRPSDKPMPVLVADLEMAGSITASIPERARRLADAFWPGPLTIVCPASDSIRGVVTAGGDTVALRAPGLPLLLELVRALGRPVIAPSANRAGEPPAETLAEFQRVFADELASNALACYCPAGAETTTGQPSTIVIPGERQGGDTILRPGPITADSLAAIAGD